jgi:transposase
MSKGGRPFVVRWREEDREEALRTAYRTEQCVEVRQRLQALWLLRSGERRLDEVAAVVGVHSRSVQRWVAWYRDGGLALVRSHRLGGYGQTPRLTPEHQERLAQEVATGRFPNSTAIRAWVAATFGVSYTEGGMYSLLERVQWNPKVPRPLHEKADLAEQETWKKGGVVTRSTRPGSLPSSVSAGRTRCGWG